METDDAPSAFHKVLSQAGVNFPKRDSVDARMVQDVLQETGGLIDDEDEVGARPDLLSLQAPIDSDADGMSDAWELALGLDPNNNTVSYSNRSWGNGTSPTPNPPQPRLNQAGKHGETVFRDGPPVLGNTLAKWSSVPERPFVHRSFF